VRVAKAGRLCSQALRVFLAVSGSSAGIQGVLLFPQVQRSSDMVASNPLPERRGHPKSVITQDVLVIGEYPPPTPASSCPRGTLVPWAP
jgi:hypothetical protein